MNVVTIVGARPQFIKAASLSRVLRKKHHEILVHTGQHYDKNMSQIFFDELDIPTPEYHLGVGSASHAKQTAEMMVKIEDVLIKEKPELLILYGDTNSTLASALVAGKMKIPIAHIEAGVRTFVKDMPEEQNRVVTDHLASFNFTPSESGLKYLISEGLKEGAYNVGDIMYDGLLYYSQKIKTSDDRKRRETLKYFIPNNIKKFDQAWYLTTIHRPENTDAIETLKSIIEGLNALDKPVIFPVHPRIKKAVLEIDKEKKQKNIHFIEPLGYLDMIYFAKNATKIITDSGGLHKEAFLMKVPSIVLLRGTGWEETLIGNCNVLAKPEAKDILEKVYHVKIDTACYENAYYGDGKTAEKIVEILEGEK